MLMVITIIMIMMIEMMMTVTPESPMMMLQEKGKVYTHSEIHKKL